MFRFQSGSATWLLAACLLMATSRRICAAEPEWKAGLAQIKITPEQPVLMSGYAARKKPFEKVATDLYVKALVLEDGEGHRAALVTSDLLVFPANVDEPICERIEKSIGPTRANILLNPSHTHTGRQVSLKLPAKDDPGEADALRIIDYTHNLQDKVVAVVEQAAKSLEPVELSWGAGVAHFVIKRREFTPDGVILGANPRGLADRSVPILKVARPDGTPRALLFGAAVHNMTLRSDYYQICADYAGFAQTLLQEKYSGVQAMFLLGCAGDADPYPFGNMELAWQHGTALAEDVARVLGTKLRPIH